jgi:hypothetical protein
VIPVVDAVKVTFVPAQNVLLGTGEEILTVCALEINAASRKRRVSSVFIISRLFTVFECI